MEPVYVKTFSKGQLTIPKKVRSHLNMPDESWVRISVQNNGLLIEPVNSVFNREEYLKRITTMKGGWYSWEEHEKFRKNLDQSFAKNSK